MTSVEAKGNKIAELTAQNNNLSTELGHLKAEKKALTLMISEDDEKAWQVLADMM